MRTASAAPAWHGGSERGGLRRVGRRIRHSRLSHQPRLGPVTVAPRITKRNCLRQMWVRPAATRIRCLSTVAHAQPRPATLSWLLLGAAGCDSVANTTRSRSTSPDPALAGVRTRVRCASHRRRCPKWGYQMQAEVEEHGNTNRGVIRSGIVPPEEFIHSAATDGLIVRIGRPALREACCES